MVSDASSGPKGDLKKEYQILLAGPLATQRGCEMRRLDKEDAWDQQTTATPAWGQEGLPGSFKSGPLVQELGRAESAGGRPLCLGM